MTTHQDSFIETFYSIAEGLNDYENEGQMWLLWRDGDRAWMRRALEEPGVVAPADVPEKYTWEDVLQSADAFWGTLYDAARPEDTTSNHFVIKNTGSHLTINGNNHEETQQNCSSLANLTDQEKAWLNVAFRLFKAQSERPVHDGNNLVVSVPWQSPPITPDKDQVRKRLKFR